MIANIPRDVGAESVVPAGSIRFRHARLVPANDVPGYEEIKISALIAVAAIQRGVPGRDPAADARVAA
jgi:hypothetical protein